MTTPAAAPALMAPDLVAAFDALLCEGGGAPALPREWHVLDMTHGRVPVAIVAEETKARAACEIWNGRHGYERFKVAHVPAMVPRPVQQQQARHVARDASGRFRKADPAPAPVVQASAAPQLPPVIDDEPRRAIVLTPEQDAWLAREERAAAADCRAREAAGRRDALILVACALAVLAVLATLLMADPQMGAQAKASGPVHVALAMAAPRAPPAAEAAACGRVAGMGEHGWQVEAARLTASTGTRSTVASLRATCAPAAR